MNAVSHGVSVVAHDQNAHRSVAAAVAEFLDETKLTKKPKTLAAYSAALTSSSPVTSSLSKRSTAGTC